MAKKVTVLGAGNAGHAAAFEISLNGNDHHALSDYVRPDVCCRYLFAL